MKAKKHNLIIPTFRAKNLQYSISECRSKQKKYLSNEGGLKSSCKFIVANKTNDKRKISFPNGEAIIQMEGMTGVCPCPVNSY